MEEIIEVDGSILEGGGQILRMSVAFSALMGVPVRVKNIRRGRKRPGLVAQHLTGLQLVAKMCNAKLTGAHLQSTEIEFVPGDICGGYYKADVKTAGSVSLLLQLALPFALMADQPVTMELKGGTNTEMAPHIDYMTTVFQPHLEKMGGNLDVELHRRGYFPKGGGHITVNIKPVKSLNSISLLDMGKPERFYIFSYVAGSLPIEMAYQMSDAAKRELEEIWPAVSVKSYKEPPEKTTQDGSGTVQVCKTSTGCVLGASHLGASHLGRRGTGPSVVGPSVVGERAAVELRRIVSCGATVDAYTQDQLILYMALASGTSDIKVEEVSMHTKTAIHVAELFTKVKFDVQKCRFTTIIRCTGSGYINKYMPSPEIAAQPACVGS